MIVHRDSLSNPLVDAPFELEADVSREFDGPDE